MRHHIGALAAALMLALCAVPSHAEEQAAFLKGSDGRGNPFDLRSLRGQPVILTFASKQTREEATEVNDTLAFDAKRGGLTVVSIVDIDDIPGYGYKSALKQMAEADRPGLIHIVDDTGRLSRALGAQPHRQVDIVVLDRQGVVRGHFVGDRGTDAALRLVRQLQTAGGAPAGAEAPAEPAPMTR